MPEDYEEVRIEDSEEEEIEVDVTEIYLNESEINYWIGQLEELREKKSGHVHIEIDEGNELIINYDSEDEDEGILEVEYDEDDSDEDGEDEE